MFEEYAMTNLTGEETGLGNIRVWVSPKMQGVRHGPRIKVSNVKGKFSKVNNFSLDLNGNIMAGECKLSKLDLARVVLWIDLNRQALLRIWNDTTHGSSAYISWLQPLRLFKDV